MEKNIEVLSLEIAQKMGDDDLRDTQGLIEEEKNKDEIYHSDLSADHLQFSIAPILAATSNNVSQDSSATINAPAIQNDAFPDNVDQNPDFNELLLWHILQSEGQGLNIISAWESGYTGNGILYGIAETGILTSHPDLDANFNPDLDAGSGGRTGHGTPVTGIIAAENNTEGGIGIAYDAEYSRIDFPGANTASYSNYDIVNISNNLTQESDLNFFDSDGHTIPLPSGFFYTGDFVAEAALNGRGELGTLLFGSAGNFKLDSATTQHRARGSFPEFMPIAAIGRDGDIASYSQPGASIFATGTADIWTTYDDIGSGQTGYGWFNGTSASTPSIAGFAGVVLDANPELGWRDFQDILAYSTFHVGTPLTSTTPLTKYETVPWSINTAKTANGGGFHFSEDYGFGLPDAHAATRLAETWFSPTNNVAATSANQAKVLSSLWDHSSNPILIPDNDLNGISGTVTHLLLMGFLLLLMVLLKTFILVTVTM